MKKLGKTILILLLIVFLFLLGLFIVRAKRSNELKSGLLREDSNGIIQQVVWGGNDLSINVNGPQTALRIPISSVVPETLTWKNFKFRLNLYDENGEKLDYVFLGEKGIPSGVSHSSVVDLIFKDSMLGMKEFKMPVGAISRINEDTFQVELEDFDGYADMAGDDIWYKILGKGKIDSVYLEIFHGNNVKLEFAIIDDEVIIEDYCEGAECKDSYPWEIEDLYGTYKLVGFNYEITDIPATLTISEKLIGAKFCNDMGSDDYSIEGNTIHVKNMVQNEMLCDSEELMEYERKFDLSNAKINLVEHNLRITTSNGDVYDFIKTENEQTIGEPTYEILEWTGYMGCIGGCEDGSDEEYVEGYYYRYTNPELGLRITTPSGDGGNYNLDFTTKRETPIFKQINNAIYSLEYDDNPNWPISDAEFIKVYEKDSNISLEDLLEQKYEDCRLEKLELGLGGIFIGFGDYFYAIESNPGNQEDNCNYREEGEGGAIIFFLESKDNSKYYKVGINDGCAPGPCSIFGEVEVF